jgi:hypothetical protein
MAEQKKKTTPKARLANRQARRKLRHAAAKATDLGAEDGGVWADQVSGKLTKAGPRMTQRQPKSEHRDA